MLSFSVVTKVGGGGGEAPVCIAALEGLAAELAVTEGVGAGAGRARGFAFASFEAGFQATFEGVTGALERSKVGAGDLDVDVDRIEGARGGDVPFTTHGRFTRRPP